MLLASVSWIDTVYTYTDTVNTTREYFEICLNGREKYGLKVDSILQGNCGKDTITVYTPEFCVNRSYSVRYSGATIDFSVFGSDNWYKLKKGNEKIVLLKKLPSEQYEVLYSMPIDQYNLNFLDSVKLYGNNIMFHLPGIDNQE